MTRRKRVQTLPNANASSTGTALATSCSSSSGISGSESAPSAWRLSTRVLRRNPATKPPTLCPRSASVQPDEPEGGPGGIERDGASALGTASKETRNPALIRWVTSCKSMCARSRDARRLAARRLMLRRWRVQRARLKRRTVASAPSTELNVISKIEPVATSALVSSGRSSERPSHLQRRAWRASFGGGWTGRTARCGTSASRAPTGSSGCGRAAGRSAARRRPSRATSLGAAPAATPRGLASRGRARRSTTTPPSSTTTSTSGWTSLCRTRASRRATPRTPSTRSGRSARTSSTRTPTSGTATSTSSSTMSTSTAASTPSTRRPPSTSTRRSGGTAPTSCAPTTSSRSPTTPTTTGPDTSRRGRR
mmetsp:Transcript_37422/g.122390  ORF Transcript_37422/g.122390 Transcript_37422/m.122390 type:complete len:366 (-) Transcript_37422:3503-4600(-)